MSWKDIDYRIVNDQGVRGGQSSFACLPSIAHVFPPGTRRVFHKPYSRDVPIQTPISIRPGTVNRHFLSVDTNSSHNRSTFRKTLSNLSSSPFSFPPSVAQCHSTFTPPISSHTKTLSTSMRISGWSTSMLGMFILSMKI